LRINLSISGTGLTVSPASPTQDVALSNLSGVYWDEQDDAALLRAAMADREAFAVFYRQHALIVYRWFAYRVRSEGTVASELTSETFAQALRSLPRFKGTVPGSGTSWLFGIARNLAREHYRSRRVRDDARRELGMPVLEAVDLGFQEVEDRIDSERLRDALAVALSQLPTAQREAVRLRIVDELDYPAIASATAASEQTARLRVSRGLRALHARLAPDITKEDR
jgi:RNA polymerase sigma-70 factor (ECF subfamily)